MPTVRRRILHTIHVVSKRTRIHAIKVILECEHLAMESDGKTDIIVQLREQLNARVEADGEIWMDCPVCSHPRFHPVLN